MTSIYSGVCQIHTPHHSVHLCYPTLYCLTPAITPQPCTWKLWSTMFGNPLRDWDQVNWSSAKCNLVQKWYAYLPDTPVALTTAFKYFQMLPAPPGGLQSALRLCKSILTCSWMHLESWRCIQDAMRLTIRIAKFWSYWDLCAGLRETSRAAETSAQALWETWCHILTPVVLRVP
jgi:hypothetical protein